MGLSTHSIGEYHVSLGLALGYYNTNINICQEVSMNKYKKGQVVRFNLTNKWQYGILTTIGYKWYTVSYMKSGRTKIAKIHVNNANTDLAEI